MSKPENPDFICPATNQPCEYYHLCAGMKEDIDAGGVHPGSILEHDYAALEIPQELQKAMWSSYCSNERVSAVGKIATSQSSHASMAIEIMVALQQGRELSVSDPNDLI